MEHIYTIARKHLNTLDRLVDLAENIDDLQRVINETYTYADDPALADAIGPQLMAHAGYIHGRAHTRRREMLA